MKRKALALVLTAAMAATALAGCGSSADTGSASTTPAASEDTAKDDTAAADTEEDGDYYVDEDGNKYKKFDDVQRRCWYAGTAASTLLTISITTRLQLQFVTRSALP